MARTTPVNSGYGIISGSSAGSNASGVDCWLEWKVLSQDAENCQSKVRVLLYAAATISSSTKWTAAENFGYVQCDGGTKQYLSTTYDFSDKQVNCFGDYTFTIDHEEDGTKSVTLAGVWSTSHSTYISGGSASGTVTLPTIEQGLVRIDTGTEFVKAIPYIDNGSEWKRAAAYIDNGSSWDVCG